MVAVIVLDLVLEVQVTFHQRMVVVVAIDKVETLVVADHSSSMMVLVQEPKAQPKVHDAATQAS